MKLQLILGKPINFDELKIYQPTIDEILDNDFSYDDLMLPFALTINTLNNENINEENFKNLDLFFLCDKNNNKIFTKDNIPFNAFLINSLKFYCKTDDVQILNNSLKINGFEINRDNYDELLDIIYKINFKSIPKKEEKKKKSKMIEDLDKYFKLGREKNNKNNSFDLSDIVNFVIHTGNYTEKQVANKTIFQLYNTFTQIQKDKNYKYQEGLSMTGHFKLEDLPVLKEGWAQQFKFKEEI